MNIKDIVNWPAKRNNSLAPAYVVVWRVIWLPVYAAGVVIATVAVLVCDGPVRAKWFWDTIV